MIFFLATHKTRTNFIEMPLPSHDSKQLDVLAYFNQLCSKLFPDSKIASKFACKHTKCTQIIKRAIAPSLEDKVVQMCKKQPFSILCDESNDSDWCREMFCHFG